MEAKLQELMDVIVHTKGAKGGHLRADISTEEGGQGWTGKFVPGGSKEA